MRLRSLLAISFIVLVTPVLAHAVTLSTLVSSHGGVSAGGVTFGNFAIGALPSPNPQGALPDDGADVDVSASAANGRVTLVFRMIDPATGASRPLHIDAANGPHDLVRHASFDVTASDPAIGLAAVEHGMGSGAHANGDCSIVDMTYDWIPELPSGQILLFASLSLNGPVQSGPSVLLADHTLARLDEEWELDSSHHGGVRSGTADLDQVNVTITTASSTLGVGGAEAAAFAVHANAPNPFLHSTTLRFTLPTAAATSIDIFDARGARVRSQDLGVLAAGAHEWRFEARDPNGQSLRAGTYFYRVHAGSESRTRRMVVLD